MKEEKLETAQNTTRIIQKYNSLKTLTQKKKLKSPYHELIANILLLLYYFEEHTQVEPSKRGRASYGAQLGQKDMTGKRKRARRHQVGPGLGDFSRPLGAGTEVEHSINFSKTIRGTNPEKETFEIHTPGSATWEIFKVRIWSQGNLDASFSHFYSMIWSHLFLV